MVRMYSVVLLIAGLVSGCASEGGDESRPLATGALSLTSDDVDLLGVPDFEAGVFLEESDPAESWGSCAVVELVSPHDGYAANLGGLSFRWQRPREAPAGTIIGIFLTASGTSGALTVELASDSGITRKFAGPVSAFGTSSAVGFDTVASGTLTELVEPGSEPGGTLAFSFDGAIEGCHSITTR